MNAMNPNSSEVHVVVPDGPADKAGLKAGDELVSVEGDAIAGPTQLFTAAGGKKPGDKLGLVIKRDGEELELQIVVGEKVD